MIKQIYNGKIHTPSGWVNGGSIVFENGKILEVKNDEHCEQSTGKIIHVPNSIILSKSLKNYTKNFKYIWSEIVVKTPLDVDSDEVKKLLYSVINSNEVVKRYIAIVEGVPNKWELEKFRKNGVYGVYDIHGKKRRI